MAFWGIKLEPGKSFIHRFDNARGRLHISQATLDIDSNTKETSAVRCIVGDKNPILLCAFLPSKKLSCALDLEFEEEDDVVFSVIGPRSVYLTGFYIGDVLCGDVVIEKKKVEVGGSPAEKEVEEGSSHGKKRKSHTIVQDVGVKKNKVSEKSGKSKKASEVEPEGANIDNMDQEPVKHDPKEKQPNEKVSGQPKDSSVPSIEIGHEKIRKPKKTYEAKPKVAKTDIVDQGPVNDEPKEKQPSEKVSEQPKHSSLPSIEVGHENGGSSKKTFDAKLEVAKTDNMDQEPIEDCDNNANTEDEENSGSIVETNKKAKEVPLDVRTFTNGMVIEELKFADTRDGKVALPGTKVTVHYIGKLKTDGILFDSTNDGAPFEFRLGVGKVIKGWDSGVSGMRVGDKRRITVPPALGYGAKGAPGKYRKIPANAWLVYEIEVVDVR